MGNTGFVDTEQAHSLLDAMLSGLDDLNEFCRIGGNDLLVVAQKLELVSRRVFGAQVKIADEIDCQQLADSRSCTSTAALLRQVLNITPGAAAARIRSAKALIPQDLPTGGEQPSVLPLLADAVAQAVVDSEHVRVILTFQKRLPGKMEDSARSQTEKFLVEQARITDARDLQAIADALENAINPDGTLHDTDPYDRMELFIGRRNKATGLTNIRGRLDDMTIEMLYRAVDGYTKQQPLQPVHADTDPATSVTELSVGPSAEPELTLDLAPSNPGSDPDGAPGGGCSYDSDSGCDSDSDSDCKSDSDPSCGCSCDSGCNSDSVAGGDCHSSENSVPSEGVRRDSVDLPDGIPDLRTAPTRLAHGLLSALKTLLNAGILPTQGGERPHVTIVMDWDLANNQICHARLSNGAYVSPAEARQILCDAQITPAILGGKSEVLDLGRSQRTFPAAIRKALVLRDGGCAWPGCSRPPAWTESHHIRYWQRDLGETCLSNGVLLCQRHHSEIHKNEWQIVMTDDGHPDFIPPIWIDPLQKPRRNTLHHNTHQRW